MGVETFLNINEFISFVLQFFLGFGIAFELPVVMYAISLTGIVDSKFWRNNFRYAAIILVIFGALITPDGSGITMWFMAVPMITIYLIGMLAIRRRERKTLKIS
jgi:sec-independent protein translocase protein TatC